jgi:hypothetical protein
MCLQIVDIGSIISQKLSAMRKMQETAATNPATPGPGYGYGYGVGQVKYISIQT